MTIRNIKLSKTSAMHYMKLLFRGGLFLLVFGFYLYDRLHARGGAFIDSFVAHPLLLALIWVIFAAEIILRFFPSGIESMGSQKQFAHNYRKPAAPALCPDDRRATLLVLLVWLALNGAIGALYYLRIIDRGILLLVSLAYSVCDMVCILFFCPFQTWFLHNKCCGTCRIYNWDYAMMFTPFVYIPHVFTWSLLALSLILVVKWEVIHRRYPERFYEESNAMLRCTNCTEHLCTHKKQLRKLHAKLKMRFHR